MRVNVKEARLYRDLVNQGLLKAAKTGVFQISFKPSWAHHQREAGICFPFLFPETDTSSTIFNTPQTQQICHWMLNFVYSKDSTGGNL